MTPQNQSNMKKITQFITKNKHSNCFQIQGTQDQHFDSIKLNPRMNRERAK